MALTEQQKAKLAYAQLGAPQAAAPAAPAPSNDISSGAASIGGAGIGAGAGLVGQLLAQQAAREKEKRMLEYQGTENSIQNQIGASQQLSERQQQAMGRLMNSFKSALIR